MQTPTIDSEALIEHAKRCAPDAAVSHEVVSQGHHSWRLRITKPGRIDIEFFWGPLTGFGASDFLAEIDPASDPDPFRPFDTYLASSEEAKKYIEQKIK